MVTVSVRELVGIVSKVRLEIKFVPVHPAEFIDIFNKRASIMSGS